MSWLKLAEKLDPLIKKGDTQTCAAAVVKALGKIKKGPFHKVLSLDFSNSPTEVARYFDEFIRAEKKRMMVRAVYTETNGFDINPGRWFCDAFAFTQYGGQDDYDWLADWESGDYKSLTLTGMEDLQKVYGSAESSNAENSEAISLCSLLVVLKFQDLIRRSIPLMSELNVPLLATGHDYDFIAQFKKGAGKSAATKSSTPKPPTDTKKAKPKASAKKATPAASKAKSKTKATPKKSAVKAVPKKAKPKIVKKAAKKAAKSKPAKRKAK